MAEEVMDDQTSEDDLDLYQIEADELNEQEELDVDAELMKIALEFFPGAVEEEKNEVEDEEERKFWERAQQLREYALQFTPS